METPKAKRRRPKQDALLTRYPPLRDTDDDDIATTRNLQKLHKELKEARPKKEVELALARETFVIRRESVLADQESVTASGLLEEYTELTKGCCKYTYQCYTLHPPVCQSAIGFLKRYLTLSRSTFFGIISEL